MNWAIPSILILLVLGLAVFLKRGMKLTPMHRWQAMGGIVGMLVGIGFVEFAGYPYPVPFITWLFGMSAGTLYGNYLKRRMI